jgi:hypothetical protein
MAGTASTEFWSGFFLRCGGNCLHRILEWFLFEISRELPPQNFGVVLFEMWRELPPQNFGVVLFEMWRELPPQNFGVDSF